MSNLDSSAPDAEDTPSYNPKGELAAWLHNPRVAFVYDSESATVFVEIVDGPDYTDDDYVHVTGEAPFRGFELDSFPLGDGRYAPLTLSIAAALWRNQRTGASRQARELLGPRLSEALDRYLASGDLEDSHYPERPILDNTAAAHALVDRWNAFTRRYGTLGNLTPDVAGIAYLAAAVVDIEVADGEVAMVFMEPGQGREPDITISASEFELRFYRHGDDFILGQVWLASVDVWPTPHTDDPRGLRWLVGLTVATTMDTHQPAEGSRSVVLTRAEVTQLKRRWTARAEAQLAAPTGA
jgi:hypothetical protein